MWVNGRELAGRLITSGRQTKADQRLDFYDISQLVKTGRNRIVVAVRAPVGIGGLIAAIDLAPENQNWLVTDAQWKIFRWWDPQLPERDPATLHPEPPQLVGMPPIGRWNYLEVAERKPSVPIASISAPRDSFEVIGLIPTIRGVRAEVVK